MSAETITLFAADGTIDRNPSVEPRLQRALTEIYGRVSHMPLFPKGGECLTATVGLSLEYGLKGQAGWFLVDEPTDPEGVKIFNLNTTSIIQTSYLYLDYHYNFNLLQSPEENDLSEYYSKAAITRSQIIANAEPFETHSWNCNASNIKDYSCV